MSILFEPVKIKYLVLPNRFVRSATYDGFTDTTGYVSEKQIKMLSDLADGGVGLIITGLAYVRTGGRP
jgi:2,4-dienoyl-CoA reductase-like NADH-dependent reductase (Old Yellow Enzyme family)